MKQQKNTKLSHHTSAFTLIELIVATAIFAIIVVSMVMVFVQALQLNQQSLARRIIQENIAQVMREFSH